MNKNPDKILIVKLCCLGDVIYSIPLLKTIKLNLPAVKITYLTANWCKDLIEIIPEVNDYIIFNAPFEKTDIIMKFYATVKLLIELRKQRFDWGINLHRNKFFAILFFISGIKIRIGFGKSKLLNIRVPYPNVSHESEKFLSLVREFNFKGICKTPDIIPSENENIDIKEFLRQYNLSVTDKLIGIYSDGGKNPGSLMEIRQLNPKKYIEFIKYINNRYNIKILLIDSKEGNGNAVKIHNEINNKERCILISKLNLKQIAALERVCIMVIGGDTGILHLAAAVNTPVIMFYGPDNPEQWAPIGNQHKVIWHKIECAPCYTPASIRDKRNFIKNTFICKRGDVLCMELITVEEMIKTFEKMYAELSD
jgi:lipopolysaccharide heptosyltransferase II